MLYSRAGDGEKCVEACDDMILWFSEGKYVLKAMELKKQYQDLSPSQQMYFDKERKVFEARQITAPDTYDVAGVSEPADTEDNKPENWPPAEDSGSAPEQSREEPAAEMDVDAIPIVAAAAAAGAAAENSVTDEDIAEEEDGSGFGSSEE